MQRDVEVRRDGFTAEEGEVLDHLVAAWRAFTRLERQHPDEERDFAAGIHVCQRILGQRIVRRWYPEGWPTYRARQAVPRDALAGRAGELRALRAAGWTLREIGERFDVSYEAVRQVLGSTGFQASRVAREQVAREVDAIVARARAGFSIKEIAGAAPHSVRGEAVAAVIREGLRPGEHMRAQVARRYPPRRGGKAPGTHAVFSNDAIVAALRACAHSEGVVPSIAVYERWRKQGPGRPCAVLARQRFGSWMAVLAAAGLGGGVPAAAALSAAAGAEGQGPVTGSTLPV